MSVSAEIFLICTNVTRTNVAWTNIACTNVTVTFVQAIFVQATFVLVTFVHIRNISAVTDMIWTRLSRQGQGKVKAMSRQGQGKFKAMSMQGWGIPILIQASDRPCNRYECVFNVCLILRSLRFQAFKLTFNLCLTKQKKKTIFQKWSINQTLLKLSKS